MSYNQFKELARIASEKGLTLAEYDTLYNDCEGDYIKMKERLITV